jgi:hypothetical protein
MKSLNRRQFVTLLATSSVAVVALPQLVKSSSSPTPPPALPYVKLLSEEATYNPSGSPLTLPSNVYPQDAQAVMNSVNNTQPNGLSILVQPGSTATAADMQAAQNWFAANAPAGAGEPVPQIGFLAGVLIFVAIIVVGGIVIYGIWRLIQLIPRPDTNVYR